jgi:hypothetical protein
MRDIKYRAWDIQDKQMLHDINLFTAKANEKAQAWENTLHWTISVDHKRFKIMQYTGLKDKNGVEIYEGDIFRGAGAYVVWNDKLACWAFTFQNDENPSTPLFMSDHTQLKDVEVIGNIYANPELL